MKNADEEVNVALTVKIRGGTVLALHCWKATNTGNETVSRESCQFRNNQESGHRKMRPLVDASVETSRKALALKNIGVG